MNGLNSENSNPQKIQLSLFCMWKASLRERRWWCLSWDQTRYPLKELFTCEEEIIGIKLIFLEKICKCITRNAFY